MRRDLFPRATILACAGLFAPAASLAQTAHAGSQSTVASGLDSASGVAVDGSNNVYVISQANGLVLKETPSGTGYIQSTVASGLLGPIGLGVDGSGAVYIANSNGGQVFKETPSDRGYTQSVVANVANPWQLAVDRVGNVYVDNGALQILRESPSGGGYIQSMVASSGQPLFVGIAVDGSGNVYATDSSQGEILEFPWTGAGYGPGITVSSGLSLPTSVALDSASNLYIAESPEPLESGTGFVAEESRTSSGYSSQIVLATGLYYPYALASGANSYIYIADDANNRVLKVGPGGAEFGTVYVGSTGSTATVYFTFDTSGNLDSATPYQVVTEGAPNLDFAEAGGSTCAANTTYSAGDTCHVNVAFTPRLAGARRGAVVLYGSSGQAIATGYICGTGVGPQVVFSPGTQSTISTGADNPTTGMNNPQGVAVDGNGNVYVASNTDNGELQVETPTDGGYVQSTIANIQAAEGVAVDGAGNVFVSSWYLNEIFKLTPSGSGFTESVVVSGDLDEPKGLAVDGSDNLYVVDSLNNRVVKETVSAGGYTQSTIPTTGLYNPSGVALNARGDIYIATSTYPTGALGTEVVKETSSGGGYSQSTVADFTANFGAAGVAVDSAGDVFVSELGGHRIVEETPSTGGYLESVVPTNVLDGPFLIALGGNGNLYIPNDFSDIVVKLDSADPPSLTFAPTTPGSTSSDSPHTLTLFNAGNAPLTLSSISYPVDFPEASSEDNACTGSVSLSTRQACVLPIDFVPTQTGVLSEIVTVTDNALNVLGTQQSVAVSGTGLVATEGATHFSIAPTPVASEFTGTPFTIDVTALNADGSTAAIYNGTVRFTSSDADFVNPGVLTLSDGVGQTTVALQTPGTQTITATDTANALLTSSGTFYVVPEPSVSFSGAAANENLGAQAVDSASIATSLTFSIAAGTNVGSIAVVTTGIENLDFTNAGGGTCSAIDYATATTCTVEVQFKPVVAGTRMGAVVFFSEAGNTGSVLGQAPIYGIGSGAQIGFAPSPVAAFSPTGSGQSLSNVRGIAVDAAGNQFVASVGSNNVVEFPAGGGASVAISPVVNGEGLNGPAGVAVDGSGDLFIADTGNNRVVELPTGGQTPIVLDPSVNGTTLSDPWGLVVDGSGDLFIADSSNGRLVELPSDGGAPTAISPVANGEGLSTWITELAVDSAGDMLIADTSNNRVVEMPAGDGTPLAIAPMVNGNGLSAPQGIAADAAGDLFISDTGNNRILELPAQGGPAIAIDPVVNGTLTKVPMGVRVDGPGNLYIVDNGNARVVELQRSLAAALSFPTTTAVGTTDTTDGTQTVLVQNLGNEALSLSVSYPADFPEVSGDASACSGSTSLINGQGCDLPVGFAPRDNGSLSEQIVLTDNALNGAGAQQSVAVRGVAVEPTPPSITTPAPASTLTGSTATFQWYSGFGPSAFVLKVGTTGAGSSDLYDGASTTATSATVSDIPTYGVPLYVQLSYEIGATWTSINYNYVEYSLPPFGAMSLVGDSLTFSSTVSQADSLEVRGWVADYVDGAPLGNVKVYIDGTLTGTPTLGIARPDVAAAQNNGSYLYSGYESLSPATTLSLGAHAVTVIAIDSLGHSTTFGPASFTVGAAAGLGAPFGGIGGAVDSTTLSSTVGQSDSLKVTGWVADPQDGAPLSNVTVYIDGTPAGAPTLGIARSDIAAIYGTTYTNSGYQFLYSAASLSLGTHQVKVTAIDSGGRSKTFGPAFFTVATSAGAGPPFGSVGEAVDNSTSSNPVLQADSLRVRGWVADATDGAPLSNVTVYLDGVSVGAPTLGIARPDVAIAFGSAYTNSGFQLLYPASTLSVGAHSVSVIAVDSDGRSKVLGPISFTVQ
jgi:sugar lactone lactonase YvrE